MTTTSITTTIANPAQATFLGTFIGSGNTSSVFAHEQSAYITYTVVDQSDLTTSWPPACSTKKVFRVTYNATVDEDIFNWNFSSNDDIETFNCHAPTVHSFDSSTGLGTSGYISIPIGAYTREALSTDYSYHHVSTFENIIMPSPLGQTNERKDDATTLNSFVVQMNTYIRQGGLEYSPTNTSTNLDQTSPEYGWEPHILC
tara:strand:- start:633 stop:1235 length:603 start_codon:yes stop_codon:yes gene_type:complete